MSTFTDFQISAPILRFTSSIVAKCCQKTIYLSTFFSFFHSSHKMPLSTIGSNGRFLQLLDPCSAKSSKFYSYIWQVEILCTNVAHVCFGQLKKMCIGDKDARIRFLQFIFILASKIQHNSLVHYWAQFGFPKQVCRSAEDCVEQTIRQGPNVFSFALFFWQGVYCANCRHIFVYVLATKTIV